MIWKLYKTVITLFIRSLVSIVAYGIESQEVAQLQYQIDRLRHIIDTIRQYSGLHPAFARDTFGSLNNYLRQRLSAHELALLTEHMSLLPDAVNAQVNHSLS